MKMRQSLTEFEAAFFERIEEDREQRERLAQSAVVRTQRRHHQRRHKRGRTRFTLLVLTLLGTAALVTWIMFQALYWVMG
jgi:hypothetical protein